MIYLRVRWIHEFKDEPILLYCEIDDDRYEIRKVEIFRNGTKGFADERESSGSTQLGVTPIPSIDEIAKEPEFLPEEISPNEFEKVWQERYK